jgi:hypothetical protein
MPDLTQLQADRDAVYAAKIQFLQKGSVKQVTRAGRTLMFSTASLEDFDAALLRLDADIAAAQDSDTTGRPRYHALSVRFG